MAARAPSAALAWLAWLLAACGWVIMLAGVGALHDVSEPRQSACLLRDALQPACRHSPRHGSAPAAPPRLCSADLRLQ